MVLILLPLVPLFITFLHGDLKLKNRLCTCISKSNYLPSDTTFSFPLRSSSVFCFSLKRQFNLDARAKFCISSSWTAMQYRVSRACFPKAFIKNSLWAVFLMCPLSNIKALFFRCEERYVVYSSPCFQKMNHSGWCYFLSSMQWAHHSEGA